MKSVCAVCVCLLGVWGAGAQTTSSAGWQPVFVAHLRLRPVDQSPGRGEPPPARAPVPDPTLALTTASSTQAALQARPDEGLRGVQLDVFRRMDREGYFDRPVRPSDSPVVRWAEGTFGEEEVKMGKSAKLSCSLYTAVKRKNPLCLLNPCFLHFSW